MLLMFEKIHNKYILSDFIQLITPVDITVWRDQIDAELNKNWNPQTKSELEYLRELCTPNLSQKFIHLLISSKQEIWDILKPVIIDKIKTIGKK